MADKKQFRFFISTHLLILVLGMIFFGFIALIQGKDLGWDLANYHYSNAYAFLHHHNHQDFWPASYIHAYLSPTADFLSYFLINYFSPLTAVFISGALQGITVWLIFLINHLFLNKNSTSIALALLLAFIGIFGALGCKRIGSFSNDYIVHLFILLFLYYHLLFLQYYSNQQAQWNYLCAASFFLGIALGLKLTAAPYVLSVFTTYIFLRMPWKHRLRMMLMSSVTCIFGLLCSSGYWMWNLWLQYHNPIFPFLNSIFHSPDFSTTTWHFERLVPITLLSTIFYPFYFSFYGTLADGFFRDIRYLYLYSLLIITLATTFVKKIWHVPYTKMDLSFYWLLYFIVFSYIFSQADFGSIRYVLAIEMLAPLLIYLLVKHLIPNTILQNIIVTVFLGTIVVSVIPQNNITRITSYKPNMDYFSVIPPTFANNSKNVTVLMSYTEFAMSADPRPVAFLMGFLPHHWHFIGIPFINGLYDLSDQKSFRKMHILTNNYSEQFYILGPQKNISELYSAALQFNLVPAGACEVIDNI
ncbi:MAG: hypothetical protein JO131_01735, partial [Gammaproteobacteria bacterium]|nr:hypothetical protein [Gammaproteobacteria bacterium]